MERSKNYNLYLPSSDDDDLAEVNELSSNFEVIDTVLGDKEELTTDENETFVGAINEVNGKIPTVDQTYDPESEHAQSGKAVAEAIDNLTPADIGAASPSGYYADAGLGAATSENLIDTKATGTARDFIFDTSCGDASITDDGFGTIAEIRGNTVIQEQSLVNMKCNAIKTVGFNACNDGTAYLLGQHKYQITGSYTSLEYSTDEEILPDSNGEFTPSANGTLTVVGGNDTTCVHLVWDGYRNGEYEQYWQNVLNFQIPTFFADGMKSAGLVYDVLTPKKAIKKVGTVDLGSLSWRTMQVANGTAMMAVYASAKSTGSARANTNGICAKYPMFSSNSSAYYMTDKTLVFGSQYFGGAIVVLDTDYTSASAFKSAMNGVLLNYEAVTQETMEIETPPIWNYKVSDFGTEQALSETETAPFKALIKYSTNFAREIANLPRNYTSGESLDNLLSVVGTALGGTFTRTYNESTGKYDFTFETGGNE